ncbi:MAG: twin-arginine translocase TatA/TatE family subunit [Deltaproteobacteria bacterium]|nr:MAG: twin-arginine translocase TatA/TatE family subunit [Deltaproteobacteria bacterium]
MEIKLATFGIWELVLILLIVIVLFGAGKLPQLGDAMGKAIRNFRKSFKGDEAEQVAAEARRIDEGDGGKALPQGSENAAQVATGSSEKVDVPSRDQRS